VVDRRGAARLLDLPLSPIEQAQLQQSAKTLQDVLRTLTW
jgi:hypothetical protein